MLHKAKDASHSSSVSPVPLLRDDALAETTPADLAAIKPQTFDETTYYTIDDAITHIGNGTFQYRLMFLTGGIWAADAMEMMLLSFCMPVLKVEWELKPPLDGAISAVVFAGMLCGVLFWSILADKFGRKKVVILSTFSAAVFGALSGLAPDIYFMLAARFFVGFAVGGSGSAYTLFAEYAPQEVRGALLVIEQGFWSFGAIFSVLLAWVSLVCLSWHWYMILSSIPLFIISAFYKWVPESSRWLLACGRTSDAEQELRELARVNHATLPDGHLKPVKVSARGNPLDAFKAKYRKHTILLYIAFFMCVFGYYGICFISTKFFEEVAGSSYAADNDEPWKESTVYWQSLITTSSELPALLIGVYILDKIGRKNTLLLAFGIFAVSSFLLVFKFVQHSAVFGVSCVFLARMNISLGFMAIYIYFSEYYPTAIRSTALGMASALGRIAGSSTSFVSEDTPFSVGIALYAISGAIAFVCSLFITDTLGRQMATSVVDPPQWLQQNLKQSVDLDPDDENYEANYEMQPAPHMPKDAKSEMTEMNASGFSNVQNGGDEHVTLHDM